jgi:DNA-binding GntR family transcriptional regulator
MSARSSIKEETSLADRLGASRTPLREALFSLEREGFVRSEVDRGFSVMPLTGREVRELYPIVWTLEGLAIRLGVPLVYTLVDRLTELNSHLEERLTPEQALELDTRWHETLVESSPNLHLKQMLTRLRLGIRRYEYAYMRKGTLIAESTGQHKKIIDALRSKDLDAAVLGVMENWRFGMEAVLIQLGEP